MDKMHFKTKYKMARNECSFEIVKSDELGDELHLHCGVFDFIVDVVRNMMDKQDYAIQYRSAIDNMVHAYIFFPEGVFYDVKQDMALTMELCIERDEYFRKVKNNEECLYNV